MKRYGLMIIVLFFLLLLGVAGGACYVLLRSPAPPRPAAKH